MKAYINHILGAGLSVLIIYAIFAAGATYISFVFPFIEALNGLSYVLAFGGLFVTPIVFIIEVFGRCWKEYNKDKK